MKVNFKSNEYNWRKEYLGLKRNTVREKTDAVDLRFDVLDGFINGDLSDVYIEIQNTMTGKYFSRAVTDVTIYTTNKGTLLYIISW